MSPSTSRTAASTHTRPRFCRQPTELPECGKLSFARAELEQNALAVMWNRFFGIVSSLVAVYGDIQSTTPTYVTAGARRSRHFKR